MERASSAAFSGPFDSGPPWRAQPCLIGRDEPLPSRTETGGARRGNGRTTNGSSNSISSRHFIGLRNTRTPAPRTWTFRLLSLSPPSSGAGSCGCGTPDSTPPLRVASKRGLTLADKPLSTLACADRPSRRRARPLTPLGESEFAQPTRPRQTSWKPPAVRPPRSTGPSALLRLPPQSRWMLLGNAISPALLNHRHLRPQPRRLLILCGFVALAATFSYPLRSAGGATASSLVAMGRAGCRSGRAPHGGCVRAADATSTFALTAWLQSTPRTPLARASDAL